MTDKKREDFEEHLTRNVSGLCTYQTAIRQHPNGDYVSEFSQERWIDWQSATLAAQGKRQPLPRYDDGDCFRLAQKLNIAIDFDEGFACRWDTDSFHFGGDTGVTVHEAVILVAAEIGKVMP